MVTAIAEEEYCNAVNIDGNGNNSNAHLFTMAKNAELKQYPRHKKAIFLFLFTVPGECKGTRYAESFNATPWFNSLMRAYIYVVTLPLSLSLSFRMTARTERANRARASRCC